MVTTSVFPLGSVLDRVSPNRGGRLRNMIKRSRRHSFSVFDSPSSRQTTECQDFRHVDKLWFHSRPDRERSLLSLLDRDGERVEGHRTTGGNRRNLTSSSWG